MLDIIENRRAQKWTKKEIVFRAVWEILRSPLFAWTPRILWGWRVTVLRMFGAKVGKNVHVFPSVKIAIPWNLDIGDNVGIGDSATIYTLGSVSIGKDATISQYAHICAGTHDYTKPDMPLIKATIKIGDGAWICADAFVGPNVQIGALAVVGARAVVTKHVQPNAIMMGNPAQKKNVRQIRMETD